MGQKGLLKNINKPLKNIIDFVDIESSDNFDDYFSLISQLDLVVTCDNTVAHIAGSLGIKRIFF